MNVLSLFDGMSCGQIALERAGIPISRYFASEIDKHAIQVTQSHYLNTIQLGDVLDWKTWRLPKIHLLIGGSPCQGFSNAGKGLNFDDPRSKLFFTYVDILKALRKRNPDVLFLLENVKMKKAWQDIISEQLGVEPVLINSALVSAQNRKRLYWANFPITQPEDRGIVLADIIENGEVDRCKSYTIDANYFKGGNPRSYFEDGKRQLVFEHQSHKRAMVKIRGAVIRNQITRRGVEEQLNIRRDEKPNAVVSSYPAKLNGVVVVKTLGHGYIKESEKEMDKYPSLCGQSPNSKHLILAGRDESKQGHDIQKRIYSERGKSPSLLSYQTGGAIPPNVAIDDIHYRKLTPIECERLQTVEDNWTAMVSNTQRYKMLGNGWTIDVIVHIFRCMSINPV